MIQVFDEVCGIVTEQTGIEGFVGLDQIDEMVRNALAGGADLAAATAEALAADSMFDLGKALTELFADGLPIALDSTPSTSGDHPCQRQP